MLFFVTMNLEGRNLASHVGSGVLRETVLAPALHRRSDAR